MKLHCAKCGLFASTVSVAVHTIIPGFSHREVATIFSQYVASIDHLKDGTVPDQLHACHLPPAT